MTSIEKLTKKRITLGITQAELAMVIGITAPGLSKIESGTVDSRESTLNRIETGLETIENNRQAKKAGVIVIDELDFKNCLFVAMIPELETRENERISIGDPQVLGNKLVKLIYENITGKKEQLKSRTQR